MNSVQKTKQYNHVSWWIGGLAVVVLLITGTYVLLSNESSAAFLGQNNSQRKTPALPTEATTKNLGGSVPEHVKNSTDLNRAEQALDGAQIDAVTTTDLSSNDADAASF